MTTRQVIQMSGTPESLIKSDIKDYLRQKGIFWSMVTGGPYSKVGDPDMVACCRGHYVAIEAKTYAGTMSAAQKIRMHQILRAGGTFICARTVDDVRLVVEKLDEGSEKDGKEEQ